MSIATASLNTAQGAILNQLNSGATLSQIASSGATSADIVAALNVVSSTMPVEQQGTINEVIATYSRTPDNASALSSLEQALGNEAFTSALSNQVAVLAKVQQLMGTDSGSLAYQTQNDIAERLTVFEPAAQQFIKDAPVYGYMITAENAGDVNKIPLAIRNHLGIVDGASYSEKWLKEGAVITLQWGKGVPDFYPQSPSNFQKKYKVVDRAEIDQKNPKLNSKLNGVAGLSEILANDPNVVAMLRTEPQKMFQMSELGYDVSQEVTIAVPAWGEGSTQTKPAGVDAYLVYEVLEFNPDWTPKAVHYYMVNIEPATGLPVGYVTPGMAIAPVNTN